jgi:hypothetical protein
MLPTPGRPADLSLRVTAAYLRTRFDPRDDAWQQA